MFITNLDQPIRLQTDVPKSEGFYLKTDHKANLQKIWCFCEIVDWMIDWTPYIWDIVPTKDLAIDISKSIYCSQAKMFIIYLLEKYV